jgi:hypothetical protein
VFFFNFYCLAICDTVVSVAVCVNLSPLVAIRCTIQNCWVLYICLKGQLHEIFDSRFFFTINPTYVPDKQAKTVLHMVSYSPR